MKLIIAEKPQVGRAIADAIPGAASSSNGYITKGDYVITWALGHLLDLKDPEDYDEELKNWSLDALPIYFPNWGMKPNDTGDGSRKERLDTIGALIKKADLVIHAGDPDDEGQYLIDEILRWFSYKGKVLRMDTNDTTQAALSRALGNLRDNKPLEKIGWSAHARRVSDKIVGYNCSRYFSLKNPGVLLTIGRVQTAALGLVVLRDLAIEGHTKINYYEIFGDVDIGGKCVTAQYVPNKDDKNLDDGRILNKSYAETKVDMLKYMSLDNVGISKRQETVQPPLPFNLTGLQTYCSVQFGYDPSQVLEITQSLRDKYNAITYNRSDCNYLSEEQYKEAPATMQQVIKNINYTPKELDMTLHSKAFNDAAITAHTAIIPQNNAVDLTKLTVEEKNVYLAICKYFMAQFVPVAIREVTTLTAPLPDKGKLSATSIVFVQEGFRKLLKKEENSKSEEEKAADERTALSEFSPGTYQADITDAHIEEKETRPPRRYTKASLAKDMTEIAKYVEDPEVKQLLLAKDKDKKGENGSIGTVATRPQIIDKLEERGYIEPSGKQIISTPLGRELYRILPNQLKKPDMTAYWWSIQEDIQAGSANWEKLTDSVLDMVCHVIVTEYPKVNMTIIPASFKRGSSAQKEVLGACPRCGSPIVEGKNGFGCAGYKAGCKFVIWKKSKAPVMSKTTVSANQVKSWLKNGWEDETELTEDGMHIPTGNKVSKNSVMMKSLYSSSKDAKFSAPVFLLDKNSEQYPSADFKISFDKIDKSPLGKCPRCGGDITEFTSGFSCSNRDSGCNFVIWKKSKQAMLSKTTITANDVKKLLAGESVKKTTLLSKSKSKFTGYLIMKDDPNSQYGPDLQVVFNPVKKA